MVEIVGHINSQKNTLLLNGTFGDGNINYSLRPVTGSNKIVINIHGTYGNKDGTNGKYETLAEKLQSNGVSAVTYESSRIGEKGANISDAYEQKKSKFVGKTFSDELEDARRVVNHTIETSEETLGVQSDELEIILNGNSLGGIIAFYLAKEFPQVKAISSVGTGIRIEKTNIPILSSFPKAEEIQEIASMFEGKFTMHQAGADNIFSEDSYQDLYDSVLKGQKNKVFYDKVGHSFRTIEGEASILPYENVYKRLYDLIANENLEDMIIYLDSKVEKTKNTLSEDLRSILKPYDPGEEISYVG